MRGYFIRGAQTTQSANDVGVFQDDATAVNGLNGNTTSNGSHSHSSPYLVHKSTANAEFAQFGSHSGPSSNKRVLSFMNNLWFLGTQNIHIHHHREISGNHTLNLNGDTETRPKNMSVNYIIKY